MTSTVSSKPKIKHAASKPTITQALGIGPITFNLNVPGNHNNVTGTVVVNVASAFYSTVTYDLNSFFDNQCTRVLDTHKEALTTFYDYYVQVTPQGLQSHSKPQFINQLKTTNINVFVNTSNKRFICGWTTEAPKAKGMSRELATLMKNADAKRILCLTYEACKNRSNMDKLKSWSALRNAVLQDQSNHIMLTFISELQSACKQGGEDSKFFATLMHSIGADVVDNKMLQLAPVAHNDDDKTDPLLLELQELTTRYNKMMDHAIYDQDDDQDELTKHTDWALARYKIEGISALPDIAAHFGKLGYNNDIKTIVALCQKS